MSIEISTYTLTPEEEKFYQLDKIDLPENLFDDLYDVFNPEEQENEHGIDLGKIFLEATIFEGSRRYGTPPPKYKTYKDRLVIDDDPQKGIDGVLLVRCKFCKELFIPNFSQVNSRVQALDGKATSGTENNFYCSDECKDKCPVYKKHSTESGIKYQRDQSFIKQANEMALSRAEYKCEICDSTEQLNVHHIKPVKTNILEIYDLDNLIVLCSGEKGCHHKYGHSDRECTTGYLAKCVINE